MRSIKVKIKNIYGKDTVYPVCKDSFLFARLADTKTLTRSTLENIKALGYAIEVQTQIL